MKLITLHKIDNRRIETYEKFEEELRKFKAKWDNVFDLDYYDKDHIVITVSDEKDYTKEIHESLCDKFDVTLQSVQLIKIQYPLNKNDIQIEFIYSPVHHYIKHMNWEDVKL